ncbi:hypothetical protein ABZY00_31130 [Streptomyces griseoflavus]|uniref:hypothetical protein n=1 Tax=Streptomyces griseoflavus TaxID=35619 RepID=UPI0033ADA07A
MLRQQPCGTSGVGQDLHEADSAGHPPAVEGDETGPTVPVGIPLVQRLVQAQKTIRMLSIVMCAFDAVVGMGADV